jgi:hypothetical protein
MRVADLLVSDGIRHASTFEPHRVVDLHRLHRRPFSFSASRYRLTKVMFVSVSTFRPEPVSAKQRLIAFALCVRPPPSV